MHPVVKPALRRGWRDLNTVQFGMTPAHSLTLGPMDLATGGFLDLLDGVRGLPLLRAEGSRMGLPEGQVDALVAGLARAGLLDDSRGGGPAADALREQTDALDRLRPDLASLSLLTREPGGAMARLAARGSLRVQVRGAGRVGTLLAALLAGAGVGEVDVRDCGRVRPWDVAPGGHTPESVGERLDEAARRAVRRASPGRPPRHDRPPRHEHPPRHGHPARRDRPSRRDRPAPFAPEEPGYSLVVLAPRDDVAVHAPDPAAAEPLTASGTPHLYAGVAEGTGIVGPFVLPGGTGCAGCLDQSRTDRDPAWPRLVAQWRSARKREVAPCDLTVATTVAGLAAAHALAFLDGESPSSAGARWEVTLPGLRWHTRPVPPHSACPCGAAERARVEHSSTDGERHETMSGQPPSPERRRRADAARPTGTWRAYV